MYSRLESTDEPDRPGLDGGIKSVCDAVQLAKYGKDGTVTDVAARFGVSRAWIIKWCYPDLEVTLPMAVPDPDNVDEEDFNLVQEGRFDSVAPRPLPNNAESGGLEIRQVNLIKAPSSPDNGHPP